MWPPGKKRQIDLETKSDTHRDDHKTEKFQQKGRNMQRLTVTALLIEGRELGRCD